MYMPSKQHTAQQDLKMSRDPTKSHFRGYVVLTAKPGEYAYKGVTTFNAQYNADEQKDGTIIWKPVIQF